MRFSQHTSLAIGTIGYASHLIATSVLGWSHAFSMFSDSALPDLVFSLSNCMSFLFGVFFARMLSRRAGTLAFTGIATVVSLGGAILLRFTPPALPLLALACCLLGMGNGFFFLLWQATFSWQSPKIAPRIIIIGSAAAGLISLTISLLPGALPPFPMLLVVLAITVSCLLLLARFHQFGHSCGCQPNKEARMAGAPLSAQLRRVFSVLGRAAFCAGALGFVRCMMPEIALRESTPDSLNILMYGGRIAASMLLLITWSFLDRHPEPLEKAYYMSFPLIATLFLFLPFGDKSYQILLSVLTYIVFSVVSMIMMILCLREARQSGMAPTLVYGSFAFCVYSLSDAGYVAANLDAFVPEQIGPIWVSVLALAAVYVLSSALFATRYRSRPHPAAAHTEALSTPKPTGPKPDGDDAHRCAAIAERGGLSPREREVLALILQGRDLPHISQALFISENTVRSHMKNIYRKLNVHSKQEILDLLEQP